MMKYLTKDNEERAMETNVVRFTILGNPIPLKRPRFHNGIVYDSQKPEKFDVGIQIRNQYKNNISLVGSISMNITFYFPISRAVSSKKRDLLRGMLKSSKPDLSNLIKFYEDVMQDVNIFNDDAQIVEISARKLYDDGNGPRVEIILKRIDG